MRTYEIGSLGAQQLRVLEIVWENDGATVQQVLDALNRNSDSPPLAYTTILATMQKLEKAGWLFHERSEDNNRAYVYRSRRTRSETIGSSLCSFAETFLGGSKTLLFQHFVDDTNISDEELDEIRKIISKRRQ